MVKSTTTTATTEPDVPPPTKTMVGARLRATGEILELESHGYGYVQFVVPGRDPDTASDLIRDGLITRRIDRGRMYFTFIEPDSPRVIAWGLTINECCKVEGVREMIPGIAADLVRQ